MAPWPRSRIARPAAWLVSMHRPHHDVEPGLLVGEVVVEEGALEPEAGVVDEQVDRPHVVLEAGAHPAGRRPVGQVGHEHLDGRPRAVARSPAASSSSRARSRATRTRSVPSRARRSAKARPMPAEAPVTSAVLMVGALYAANLRPGAAHTRG